MKTLEKILRYKNDLVIDSFRKEYRVSKKEAEDIFQETLKWLYLCAFYKENPQHDHPHLGLFEGNLIVDKMWHSFILCTSDYHDFCNKYLGTYIHHQPSSSKEQKKYKRKMKKNPRKVQKEARKNLLEIIGFVYDVLGDETVVKWYKVYPKKYSLKEISRLRCSSVA